MSFVATFSSHHGPVRSCRGAVETCRAVQASDCVQPSRGNQHSNLAYERTHKATHHLRDKPNSVRFGLKGGPHGRGRPASKHYRARQRLTLALLEENVEAAIDEVFKYVSLQCRVLLRLVSIKGCELTCDLPVHRCEWPSNLQDIRCGVGSKGSAINVDSPRRCSSATISACVWDCQSPGNSVRQGGLRKAGAGQQRFTSAIAGTGWPTCTIYPPVLSQEPPAGGVQLLDPPAILRTHARIADE